MRTRPLLRWQPARRRTGWRTVLGLAAALLTQAALPGPADVPTGWTAQAVVQAANAVRREGCAELPGAPAALLPEPRLDAAAALLSHGRALEDALVSADYPVVAATSMRLGVRGLPGELSSTHLRDALARRFCAQLASAEFTAVGAASDGRDAWLVLASPFAPPGPEQANEVTARVLELVNTARLRGRHCGSAPFDGAPALARSAVLDRAAMLHARDLVLLGTLSHRGSDGGRAADRVRQQGYAWTRVAENLAAGATSAEQVVAGWFDSPAHCANLMGPGFTETGIAYVLSHQGAGEIYWVQVFATP